MAEPVETVLSKAISELVRAVEKAKMEANQGNLVICLGIPISRKFLSRYGEVRDEDVERMKIILEEGGHNLMAGKFLVVCEGDELWSSDQPRIEAKLVDMIARFGAYA